MAQKATGVIRGTARSALGYSPDQQSPLIDALSKIAGHMATDPMTYLYGAVMPGGIAGRLVNAGFAIQMGQGAVESAGRLGAILDRSDIPLQEKYDLGADIVVNALMAAHSAGHAIKGDKLPIDQRMLAEIERLGAEAQRQIFSRVPEKLIERQRLLNERARTAATQTPVRTSALHKKQMSGASQPPAHPADVRSPETAQKSADSSSPPSSQLAAIASRSDIPVAQKHELMASAILANSCLKPKRLLRFRPASASQWLDPQQMNPWRSCSAIWKPMASCRHVLSRKVRRKHKFPLILSGSRPSAATLQRFHMLTARVC